MDRDPAPSFKYRSKRWLGILSSIIVEELLLFLLVATAGGSSWHALFTAPYTLNPKP